MLSQDHTQLPVQWNDDTQRYLPEMTALFIEGLAREPDSEQGCAIWPNTLHGGQTLPQGNMLKPPAASKIAASVLATNKPIISCGDEDSPHSEAAPNEKLRTFMCGISNCFNNIFMGIWGNVSLIHLNKSTSDSVLKGAREIERLIQHGSVLNHIVFGYLAESRTEARHIRLNQLLTEINESSLSNDGGLNSKTIESCMLWASSLRNPARLARSISRVIEKLLCWIDREHQLLMTQGSVDEAIRARLVKIDALIKRGFALAGQLKLYAGDVSTIRRRMRMKPFIKRSLKQVDLKRYGIRLETDMAAPLPDIMADRSRLSDALQQMIFNAIDAMPNGGRLKIGAHLLSQKTSQEGLFAHPGVEYIVVTVSDNGEGMASQVQRRIFDPFYAGDHKSNRLGLGLSVASGIIKAHGGYIQVNSRQGRGSTFKIYLPCPRQNQSEAGTRKAESDSPNPQRVHAALACTTR